MSLDYKELLDSCTGGTGAELFPAFQKIDGFLPHPRKIASFVTTHKREATSLHLVHLQQPQTRWSVVTTFPQSVKLPILASDPFGRFVAGVSSKAQVYLFDVEQNQVSNQYWMKEYARCMGCAFWKTNVLCHLLTVRNRRNWSYISLVDQRENLLQNKPIAMSRFLGKVASSLDVRVPERCFIVPLENTILIEVSDGFVEVDLRIVRIEMTCSFLETSRRLLHSP